jgi:hypothetical protein
MPAQGITVTPAKATGGNIVWELCHKAPSKPEVCGDATKGYPPVILGHNSGTNSGDQVFTVTINDVNKLGINFSSDPLWIQPNSKPKSHVIDQTQIFGVTPVPPAAPTKLIFKDKNDGNPVKLVYQLNFVGADHKPVASIDPDIRNGGTTIIGGGGQSTAAVVVAAAGLLLLLAAIVMSIRAIRRQRQSNPGGRP